MNALQTISPGAAPVHAATNVVPLSPNKVDINTSPVWITRFEDETAPYLRHRVAALLAT